MANTAYHVNSSWVEFVGTYNDTFYIQFKNGDCAYFYNITGANAEQWVNFFLAARRPFGPGTIVDYQFKFAGQAYRKISSPVGPILNGALDFFNSGAWIANSTRAFIEAWGQGADGATGLPGPGPGAGGGGGAYAASHVSGLVVGNTYNFSITPVATIFDTGAEVTAVAATGQTGGQANLCTGTTSRFSGGDGGNPGAFPGGGGSSASPNGPGSNGNSFGAGGIAPAGGGNGGNVASDGQFPGGGGGGGAGIAPAGHAGHGLLRIWPE